MLNPTFINMLFLLIWAGALALVIHWAAKHRQEPAMPRRKKSKFPRRRIETVRVRF